MKKLYLAYALIVTSVACWATWTGWYPASVEKLDHVPKSVRDNPGSYRSHYSTYHRYYGGK